NRQTISRAGRPLRRHQRRGRHGGQSGGGGIQSDFEEVTCIVGAETSEFKTKADLRASSSATPAWSYPPGHAAQPAGLWQSRITSGKRASTTSTYGPNASGSRN